MQLPRFILSFDLVVEVHHGIKDLETVAGKNVVALGPRSVTWCWILYYSHQPPLSEYCQCVVRLECVQSHT
jgi:hypothetical protein